MEQHPQSGHVALDSTFFERGHASQYSFQRSDRDIQTLKVTTITDTKSLAVLDLQYSIHRKHDVKAGPQVVNRNADDLLSVAADKAFHSWINTFEFYTLNVDPLVLIGIVVSQFGLSPTRGRRRPENSHSNPYDGV